MEYCASCVEPSRQTHFSPTFGKPSTSPPAVLSVPKHGGHDCTVFVSKLCPRPEVGTQESTWSHSQSRSKGTLVSALGSNLDGSASSEQGRCRDIRTMSSCLDSSRMHLRTENLVGLCDSRLLFLPFMLSEQPSALALAYQTFAATPLF